MTNCELCLFRFCGIAPLLKLLAVTALIYIRYISHYRDIVVQLLKNYDMSFPFSLEIYYIYYKCTFSSRGTLSMMGDLTLSLLLGLCLNSKACILQTEFDFNFFQPCMTALHKFLPAFSPLLAVTVSSSGGDTD